MKLGFSLGQHQSLKLHQSQRLSHNLELTLKLELLQILHQDNFKPEAVCPACGRCLTLREIISGFVTDPQDFTTLCTSCGARFEARLVCRGSFDSRTTLRFYCPSQTLHQLYGFGHLSTEEFRAQEPSLYYSAIFHFGNLRRAFQQIDIEYKLEITDAWKDKVLPFLGRLPDTIIAQCAGVSVKAVRQWRRQQGFPAYNHRG